MTTQTLPTDPVPDDARQYGDSYLKFLADSPTSYHAAAQSTAILEQSGFTQIDRTRVWPTQPGRYFLVRGGALLAWIQGAKTSGFAVVAAHTDSPALKIKPRPQRDAGDGFGQLMVQVYGGALHNTWVDRELLVAGMVEDWSGTRSLVRTAPIAFIPQLAPHLDREINQKGLVLDPQRHLQPVWLVDRDKDFTEFIAHEAGLAGADQIASSELFLTTAQPPNAFGIDGQFLMGARQDNLSSTFAALQALCGLGGTRTEDGPTPVMALFDHEEIGSGSPTGASGPLLEEVLERIASAQGADREQFWQMRGRSTILSVDAAHSLNPAYPAAHDPTNRPVLGRGPVLKVDANQSYSTSLDGVAAWRRACRKADVPNQVFASHSSKRPGSTVGPLLSTRTGIDTVDVGIPLLSMHSTRETSHVLDGFYLSGAINAFWQVC